MTFLRRTNLPASKLALFFLLLAFFFGVSADAATGTGMPGKKRARRQSKPVRVDLVWHVETAEGAEVSSIQGDVAINPASVIKVATTLWALERLGPEHRFETLFSARGTVDEKRGVLSGDLIVRGGGDPDFQIENAFLVAARLNRLGIRQVRGALRVNDQFWIGWEGGSERALKDPSARALQMSQRLRAALDPKRWSRSTRNAWHRFASRYSLPVSRPPSVAILGGTARDAETAASDLPLVTHRSKPLVETLRRFDCYSNNDIERLEVSLGTPWELAEFVAGVVGVSPAEVQLQTISGLGSNRMTPRQVVRLLHALRDTCTRLGLSVESVLPVAGCDPGTLTHSFAPLGRGSHAMSVAAKTGTLTSTDGGTVVLAGFANTGKGDLLFCVVAPRAAGKLSYARGAQMRWLQDLMARSEGPRPRTCAGPLGYAESGADLVVAEGVPVAESRRAGP